VLVVEGERFPALRNVLAALSEYFRGLLLSGMQEGSVGQQKIEMGEVSALVFRVVLRHLYTAEMLAWGEEEGERAAGGGGLVRVLLKAADKLQAEGLFKKILEAFRGVLTVYRATEQRESVVYWYLIQ
jgi:hypothetical protein